MVVSFKSQKYPREKVSNSLRVGQESQWAKHSGSLRLGQESQWAKTLWQSTSRTGVSVGKSL
jgi:hypothetical protein